MTTNKQCPSQVFIVEDHPIVRHGLKQLIETQPDLKVCGEAERVSEATKGLEAVKPDIVLIDLALKDGDGMDLIRQVKQHWIDVRMIVVSTYDAATYAPMALKAGAMGYVNKHEAIDQIIDAIRQVLDGKVFVGEGVDEEVSHWFG